MAAKKRSLKLPSVLITLGQVLELRIGDDLYKWKVKDKMMLYTTTKGDQLVMLKPQAKDFSRAEFLARLDSQKTQVDAGRKLYEKWHECEAVSGSIAKPPKGWLYQLGRCTSILYRSDKWNGKQTQYVHEFKTPPLAWGSNTKATPKVVILTGGKISVKNAGITG